MGAGSYTGSDIIQRPPCGQNDWHSLLRMLPCPKLHLRAVMILGWNTVEIFTSEYEIIYETSYWSKNNGPTFILPFSFCLIHNKNTNEQNESTTLTQKVSAEANSWHFLHSNIYTNFGTFFSVVSVARRTLREIKTLIRDTKIERLAFTHCD